MRNYIFLVRKGAGFSKSYDNFIKSNIEDAMQALRGAILNGDKCKYGKVYCEQGHGEFIRGHSEWNVPYAATITDKEENFVRIEGNYDLFVPALEDALYQIWNAVKGEKTREKRRKARKAKKK